MPCPYCGALLVWGRVVTPPGPNEYRYGCLVPDRGGSTKVRCRGCRKVVLYRRALEGNDFLEQTKQPKWWEFWW